MSSIRVTRGGDVFRLPCNDTDTLLALLRRAGCTLPAACGGHGRCGKCRVSVNGVPRVSMNSAFITEIIAAILKSPDNKFRIDLQNKLISIEV